VQLREGLLFLYQHYAAPEGLWSDNHARDGRMLPTERRINGPNVYHIAVALLEAKRVLELIEKADGIAIA
jgi:mannose/cellobiose epimerase-like protein (N-acyl-D-glucosamine 2-epimerase family)